MSIPISSPARHTVHRGVQLVVSLVASVLLCAPCLAGGFGHPLACLPELPAPASIPGISPSPIYPGNYPVIPVSSQDFRTVTPKSNEALCGDYLGQRKLRTFTASDAESWNDRVHGRPHPAVNAIVSIAAGLVSPVAGAAYAIFSEAVASARPTQIHFREGDELWRVDAAGWYEGEATYALYHVLIDPYREKAWLLNERRLPIVAAEDSREQESPRDRRHDRSNDDAGVHDVGGDDDDDGWFDDDWFDDDDD